MNQHDAARDDAIPGRAADRAAERARERAAEAPGAGSGAERDAGRRDVPGTASTAEGYRPGEGTAGGEALAGVEKDPREDDREE
ncbi:MULTISPECIES: hypothetical protein [Streptomyces]|uniref:Uncharacterized protein n=1 Tax=Streptomyces changanensis TaxID=2964669 RepID=A0ABY5N5A1_9ACTN|nr:MULTISPECIES: hypothetical protein [Streptomyces]UUS29603.1 hypothetical protein NRO40_01295 [Streptomyces changanensis]